MHNKKYEIIPRVPFLHKTNELFNIVVLAV